MLRVLYSGGRTPTIAPHYCTPCLTTHYFSPIHTHHHAYTHTTLPFPHPSTTSWLDSLVGCCWFAHFYFAFHTRLPFFACQRCISGLLVCTAFHPHSIFYHDGCCCVVIIQTFSSPPLFTHLPLPVPVCILHFFCSSCPHDSWTLFPTLPLYIGVRFCAFGLF